MKMFLAAGRNSFENSVPTFTYNDGEGMLYRARAKNRDYDDIVVLGNEPTVGAPSQLLLLSDGGDIECVDH